MRSYLLALSVLLLTMGCEQDKVTCLGCDDETPLTEFEFTISGNLYENCQGAAAINRTLELHVNYQEDSLLAITHSDHEGHFSLTYKKMLPAGFELYVDWLSDVRLMVIEDSTTYFIPGLQDVTDLSLTLNDSLDLLVYLDAENLPLDAAGTIKYWFGSRKKYPSTEFYFKKGPTVNHEVINVIQDPWRSITIDANGIAQVVAFWEIKRGDNQTFSDHFQSNSSKSSCVMQRDTIVLTLN